MFTADKKFWHQYASLWMPVDWLLCIQQWIISTSGFRTSGCRQVKGVYSWKMLIFWVAQSFSWIPSFGLKPFGEGVDSPRKCNQLCITVFFICSKYVNTKGPLWLKAIIIYSAICQIPKGRTRVLVTHSNKPWWYRDFFHMCVCLLSLSRLHSLRWNLP